MDLDKFVERKLWLVDSAAGGRSEICIEIGCPRWTEPEVQAACTVFIRGLMSAPLDIFGSDLLSALECGLGFVNSELKNLPANQQIQWPGGESYFD
jgi:hypothetical protein